MSQLSRTFIWFLVLAFTVAACHDSIAVKSFPDPCNGQIQVGVIYGTGPTFVWSPRCGISALTVTPVPSAAGPEEEPVWGFQVPERSPLGPYVRYGDAPDRATVWSGPRPLRAGATYQVAVVFIVGGDVVTANGAATFTWWPPD